MITELRRRGDTKILAVANPLRGLQRDAAYVRSVLESIDGPIVVAAHSYGGSVMTEGAAGVPNVEGLVYAASFALDVGENTADLVGKFPGAQLAAATYAVPFRGADGESGEDVYIDADRFHAVFAADVEPEVAAQMAATQRPIISTALADRVTNAAWKTVPSWNLIAKQDLAIPADSIRFMAERAKSVTVEIDASHAVTVSQPGAVADLIHEAVSRASSAVGAGDAVGAR